MEHACSAVSYQSPFPSGLSCSSKFFLLPFSFLLSLLSYFSLSSLSTLFFFPDFPSSLVGQERCRHCLPLTSWPRTWREQRPCWSSMRRGSRRSGTNRRSEWNALYRRTDTQTHAHKHTHARMHPGQTKALSMLLYVLCIYTYFGEAGEFIQLVVRTYVAF